MYNMYNRIVSKNESGWEQSARQGQALSIWRRCCIIKSAATALCFQWIRQAASLPNRNVISKPPRKDLPHGTSTIPVVGENP